MLASVREMLKDFKKKFSKKDDKYWSGSQQVGSTQSVNYIVPSGMTIDYGTGSSVTGMSSSVTAPRITFTHLDNPTNQPLTAVAPVATDTRLNKKPIEIYNELYLDKPIVAVANLDQQIATVKKRIEVLTTHTGANCTDEKQVLKYLEARKAYIKHLNKTRILLLHKPVAFDWPVTNKEMIDKLCQKYKVKLVSFDAYYKNVPAEAIDELEKFAEVLSKVSKDKPKLQLIVDDGGKETKKDPIMLANSPFGTWLYILGAWDKEVEIVDDLIYKGK